MPMLKSHTFQSASGQNTITRPTPQRSGGDYPSGQQVAVYWINLQFDWRLIQHSFRSMIWSSWTFPLPRSSRPWGWMTISGFKPSSIMKSWSGLGVRNQLIHINNSCGESLEWESLILRQLTSLWTPWPNWWGTHLLLGWDCARCGERPRVEWVYCQSLTLWTYVDFILLRPIILRHW